MRRVAAVLGLVLLVSLTVSAQKEVMTATIPFDFVAGKTTMPAGNYRFTVGSNGAIEVTNLQNNKSIFVAPVTRLAAMDMSKALVTFDVLGEKHVLESVLPAGDDGYLLAVTKEKHTHHVVKAG